MTKEDITLNSIEIYSTIDGKINVEVKFNNDTIWLNLSQLGTLFSKDKSVISKHLKNIFESGELSKESVVAKIATTANDGKNYNVEYYNLDAIISVGYRVNSKTGTKFRQWATSKLKELTLNGYSINENRLAQKNKEIQVLHNGIRILSRVIEEKINQSDSINWLEKFNSALKLLDDYDNDALDGKGLITKSAKYPSINDYEELIIKMKNSINSQLFGLRKDFGFESAINQIQLCIGDQEIYSSIEEKAAVLLYLIVKNHPFIDGNKRIAAACFLLFLNENNLLFIDSKKSIIDNDTIASLTLYIAISNSNEFDTVKHLLISVLSRKISSLEGL